MAFSFDNVNGILDKYIDGKFVGRQEMNDTDPPLDIDRRFTLEESFDLFSDENFETAGGYINSLQFHDRILSAQEIAARGGPTASGIPAFGQGDINLDGELNLLDVAPFVDLLTNGNFQPQADLNEDGTVDLLDVAPLVEILIGG